MQITFTGHSVELTPALKEFTQEKLHKLMKHSARISSINVTFGIEKLNQIVEATIHLAGNDLHAKSESHDMYNAIDTLVDKLDRQLIKHKEKSK